MKTTDFEKQIQKDIDPDLNIRTNPNHKDIAGVYWNDIFIGVSVPPEEIKEEFDGGYRDAIGYPYKNVQLALDFISGKLAKVKKAYKEEPELFNQK